MELILKATLIIAIAFAVNAALGRASAAMRHLVWAAAFACLLALPIASLLAPKWTPPPVIAVTKMVVVAAGHSTAPAPARHFDWLLILWCTGAALVGSRTLVGLIRVRRIARKATAFGDGLIRRSCAVKVPITCGLLRPVILIPEDAGQWTEEKLRNVIAHEMAHVQRRDWLAHLGAQLACALYWFHPLVWLAAARMGRERERACDDLVLGTGVQPSRYAAELLEFSGAAPLPGSVGMAGLFEHRLRAILDPRINRRRTARRHVLAASVVAVAVLAPVAAFRAFAQTPGAALSGSVYDASGAAIPGAMVTISDAHGAQAAITADDGMYSFAIVPPGSYNIDVEKAGFQSFRGEVNQTAKPQQMSMNLAIGQVSQVLTVVGTVPAPATPSEHAPHRVRVGGDVQPAKLLEHVTPAYPEDLQKQGIQGAVIISAVISTDGHVLSGRVVNSANQELADAALDAVRQWRYAPVLLNGEPIEVVTTITINFALPH